MLRTADTAQLTHVSALPRPQVHPAVFAKEIQHLYRHADAWTFRRSLDIPADKLAICSSAENQIRNIWAQNVLQNILTIDRLRCLLMTSSK